MLLLALRNEATLHQRLQRICDVLGDEVLLKLQIDASTWIARVKRYRNTTAHAATFVGSNPLTLSAAYSMLSRTIRAVMLLLLLRAMEMSKEQLLVVAEREGSKLKDWSTRVPAVP